MALTIENLKPYPSGFLGNRYVAQSAPIDIIALKNRLFDNGPLADAVDHTCNMEAQSLWEDIEFGDEKVKSFDFREKIIKVALNAFGTDSFPEWIAAQEQSLKRGSYHQAWIEETVKFVLSGIPRDYSYNVWMNLITVGQHEGKASAVLNEYFGFNSEYRGISIADFICMWVARPKGVDDLAASLKLLFGKR